MYYENDVTLDYPWIDLATPTLAANLLQQNSIRYKLTPNRIIRPGANAVHRLVVAKRDANSAMLILTKAGLLPSESSNDERA